LFFSGRPGKSPEQKKSKTTKQAALSKKPAQTSRRNTDVDFQAFIGRFRKAVAARPGDAKSMMTPGPDKFEPEMSGIEQRDRPGVFQYWDQQGLWTELDGSFEFEPKGTLVAPPPCNEGEFMWLPRGDSPHNGAGSSLIL
jgi:hypothetical protein